ncbi:MAG: hypothetical protein NZM09_01785 [Ignavibacterium sp.]|nr:hypothetical protein [Ignavibacterium sp.]MDW8374405.1 hypothetical protein [Ignavibacteriales bacterium]
MKNESLKKLNKVLYYLGFEISKIIHSIFLLIFIYINQNSFAQTYSDSLELEQSYKTRNNLFSIFDKQLNVYSLNSFFSFSNQIENYQISINENFRSSYIKGIENTFRDENQLNIFLANQINENLDLGIKFRSSILSDSRKLEINQASISSLSTFSKLKFFDSKFNIIPFVGYSVNNQISEKDWGAEYGFEVASKNLEISDFIIDSDIKFKNEDISPRKNFIRLLGLQLVTEFDKNIVNNFNIKFAKNRKDFYFAADSLIAQNFNVNNNLQSRIETQYFASNKLILISFFDYLSFESEGKINLRKVNRETRYKLPSIQSSPIFDTEINELKLEFDLSLVYKTETFNSNLKFSLSERDEKNSVIYDDRINLILYEQRKESEEQKNNNSTFGTLSFEANYTPTNKDKVSLSFYQSKLKYDTQSFLNDDDRDEILTIIRLYYSRILNPFFTLFLNTEANQSHTVYIFSSKSSNNNINRVFRFRTGSEFNSKLINSSNIFEVSANYTSYDFEDLNSKLRSFSYRQFTALDSTKIFLTKRMNFNFIGYIKMSEQGDFNWKSFSEKPRKHIKEIFIEPKFELEFYQNLFAFGMRYFRLSSFNYRETKKVFDSEFLSYGPVVMIFFNTFSNLLIKLQGYYEFAKTSNFKIKQQANMNLNINWNF